jgi:Domain of unknown function (DUF4499)
MALPIVVISLLLGYATLFLGVRGIVKLVHHIPQLNVAAIAAVGSTEAFARMLTIGWYFMIAAHSFEAVFVYLHAKRSLRLKEASIMEWVIFTLIAGLPIVNRFFHYLEVQHEGRKKLV